MSNQALLRRSWRVVHPALSAVILLSLCAGAFAQTPQAADPGIHDAAPRARDATLRVGDAAARADDAAPATYLARSLFADRKAYRPGDILTVLITEVASATSSARTRTDKEESAFARFLQQDGEPRRWDAALGSDFDGGGDIERSGRLLARLAVTVERIDAQGNLHIRGEQEIHLNNEHQRIRLEGFVRAEDVAFDNTVPSWRVSGARIDFVGKGVLARRQRPGLFTRILELFRLT